MWILFAAFARYFPFPPDTFLFFFVFIFVVDRLAPSKCLFPVLLYFFSPSRYMLTWITVLPVLTIAFMVLSGFFRRPCSRTRWFSPRNHRPLPTLDFFVLSCAPYAVFPLPPAVVFAAVVSFTYPQPFTVP